MCYADITCGNGPGPMVENVTSSLKGGAIDDRANSTGKVKNIMTITIRGSYCGSSHDEAISSCSRESHCSSDDDCFSGECHDDISCTYSVRDIASLKDVSLNFKGVIVGSMLEDISSSTIIRAGLRYYLIGLGLCVIGWALLW